MIEALAFIRIAAAFALFYAIAPVWCRGKGATASPAGWASAFVRFSFVVEATVVLLGAVELALPGAVLSLSALWLALDVLQREPALLERSKERRAWLIRRLATLEQPLQGIGAWGKAMCRRPSGDSIFCWAVLGITLIARAFFPIQNLRFADVDGYARSLSLAVLSNGQDWMPDFSVPLLLPLQYLGAATPPRVVAFSAPIFAALLVAAIGFTVFRLGRNRFGAAASMGCASLWTLSPLGDGAASWDRTELGTAFVILAIGLWSVSRIDSALAAILGGAIGLATSQMAESALHSIPFFSCVLFGVGVSQFAFRPAKMGRRIWASALTATLAIAGIYSLGKSRPDGPIQYEAAARIAQQLAKDQPRNRWALVATTQELPYVYGNGWHIELGRFVADTDPSQVTKESYCFPFPVQDVYFLVETTPLVPYSSGKDRPAAVRVSPDLSSAYGTELERASLEFQLAQLLAAYRQTHEDLEAVYRTPELVLFRADGRLHESAACTAIAARLTGEDGGRRGTTP
jgi:hypothetical protein